MTLSGTAGATTDTVTGGPATYNVAVSGMTGDGTVIASILASVAEDLASNLNTVSTSSDNTVTFASNQAPIAADDTLLEGVPINVAVSSGPNPIDVLANDRDPNSDPITIVSVTQGSQGGTVLITGGGTGLTYEPPTGVPVCSPPDTFTYTIEDIPGAGAPLQDAATVEVFVGDCDGNDGFIVGDNCPTVFNPAQTNTDLDVLGAGGATMDGVSIGDGLGDACDDDDDDDGTSDSLEAFIGTDPLDNCGVNAWPPDTSDNNFVSAGDFGLILDSWQLTDGVDGGYIRRADLSGNGTVSAGDFGLILDFWQLSCT